MTRSITVAILALALTCTAIPAFAQPSLDDIEKAVAEAWAKHKSLTGVLSLEADVPINDTTMHLVGSGSIQSLKADGKEMFRETLGAGLTLEMKPLAKAELVFDGSDFYLIYEYPGNKETKKSEPALEKGTVPPGGKGLLDALKSQLTLTPKSDAKVGELEVFTLEATLKNEAPEIPVERAVISIDKATGALAQFVLYGADNAPVATVTASDLKTDTEVDPALFSVTMPEPAPTS